MTIDGPFRFDASAFTLLSDPATTFQEFCTFCKIESPPPVQGVIT
jgi:hypothetical protein